LCVLRSTEGRKLSAPMKKQDDALVNGLRRLRQVTQYDDAEDNDEYDDDAFDWD
jgi:hypothetical protein